MLPVRKWAVERFWAFLDECDTGTHRAGSVTVHRKSAREPSHHHTKKGCRSDSSRPCVVRYLAAARPHIVAPVTNRCWYAILDVACNVRLGSAGRRKPFTRWAQWRLSTMTIWQRLVHATWCGERRLLVKMLLLLSANVARLDLAIRGKQQDDSRSSKRRKRHDVGLQSCTMPCRVMLGT